jgi:monovalent cation/proton antiporter MnhG/PhaG subunit
MTTQQIVSSIALVLVLLGFLAAISRAATGPTRASAVSKAAALGLLLIIVAAMIAEWSVRSLIVLLLVLIAHLVTTPLSGTALARASYKSGTARAPVTTVDEPAEREARKVDESPED